MRSVVAFLVHFFLGFVLIGCNSFEKPVPPIGTTDELVVITVKYTANFYRNEAGGYSGLTFDLVTLFARELGLKTRFVVMQRPDEALLALKAQQGHLAVGLHIPVAQQARVRLGPIYLQLQHHVAFNTNNSQPIDFQSLVGKKIEIPIGTIYESKLNKIKQTIPSLKWSAVDTSSEHLLVKLAEGEIAFTVSDASQIKQTKLFYPNVGLGLNLGKATSRRWLFSQFAEPALLSSAQQFFARIQEDGTLDQLVDRYDGHLHRLTAGDVRFFLKKMRVMLPNLRNYFTQAEKVTGLDWRLIAALAYQESEWDPLATSHTGVRGMMMLTKDTAKWMKVTNRLDAQQSILAGARYLLLLKNKLSQRIAEPDRTWIALAAYNLGLGHIFDARTVARRFNLNPDLWVDLKNTLPLLSKREYFNTLKYGRTRGGQAVILTESVRAYYEIMMQYHGPNIQDSPASINTVSLP
tara:strand:- start:264 stop:1655 length:1392 start_codon:yes stop_codon:yes gene_type:complete